MPVDATSSSTSASLTAAAQSTGALDKDAFLKLLMTQLQYQDPLDPMDDQAYIAQLAQFSSLEQATQLNTQVTSLGLMTATTQALALVGRNIDYTDGNGAAATGKVTGVSFANGSAQLEVGDVKVAPANVSRVW